MISDSTINSSIPSASKDFGKKKRANRSAKLKQCKLDARRQQWLNQVSNNGSNSGGNGNNGPITETKKEKKKGKGKEREREEVCCKGVEVRNVNVEQIKNCDGDSEEEEEEVMANSPTSSVNDSVNSYGGSSSSSSSSRSSASSVSFGSGGCCSGSVTEEEEGRGPGFGGDDDDGDGGCLDDWETVADALVGVETKNKLGSLDDEVRVGSAQNVDAQVEKGKSDCVGIVGRGGVNSKAWRPDDASRPQSLPNLSTRGSFLGNPWGRKMTSPVPTSCPICCEDLDLTDSSFLPCPCGFHLCLFCHKRILEEDARCPGCRKPYSSEADEKDTPIRLARSCSMFSRV
ncbi:uncharacterized protein LOC141652661 [Silene latifolia]|uniref:uncharacterized protein LOC141652661 n=1 Tax=Silene latifolia TaxID=37657 RepID=UPI003D779144